MKYQLKNPTTGVWIAPILVCLSTVALGQTTAYTITTIAGNGSSGFSGDNGPASAAVLSSPAALALDSSGNLYIVDGGNQRIRKIASGNINTIAGTGVGSFSGDGGAATSAQINNPGGVAVDSSGNLYIADTSNGLIRKVSASGTITTVAGNTVSGPGYADSTSATQGQLSLPTAVVVDSAGNLYIAEGSGNNGVVQGNNRIRKVSTSGALTTYGGTGSIGSAGDNSTATTARLNNPLALAIDKAGNLYIADSGNHKIRKIAPNGIITTVAGIGGGVGGFSGDGGPAINAQLNNPSGVAVDAAGNLYIADKTNFRIRMVAPDGTISSIAGRALSGYSGDGGAATSASLKFPAGVAVDAAGNVYVADTQNSAIRLLTPSAPSGSSGPPSIGGVVSASSFGGFSSIAPGSWVEIYGKNLAATTDTWDKFFSGINAPTTIARTSVLIGGQSAFIDYISPTQVNAQVPSNVLSGTQQVIVNTAAGASNAVNINVNATQPGLLAPPSFLIGGKQYVVAQFLDGAYVLPPNAIAGLNSRRAKPGDTIVIYGVGFGAVTPSIPAGQIVQVSNSLALPVTLSIGGAPAPLGYFGLVQSAIGLYQFNVTVPSIPDNDLAPLTFTLGGSAGSQTLFLAVRN